MLREHADLALAGTLVGALRSAARATPERSAFTFLRDGERDEAKITYGALDLRARAIAQRLLERHAPGDRALVLFPAGLDFMVAFFGCLYAGLIAVPAYPPNPSRLARTLPRTVAILRDAQATAILASRATVVAGQSLVRHAAELERAEWIATDDEPLDEVLLRAAHWRPPPVGPESIAFLQYTSGSTGEPKGVVITHDNVLANEQMIERCLATNEESVVVGWVPLHHDLGLICHFLHVVWLGARGVFMSPFDFLQRPRRWLEAITRYRGVMSGGPNFAFDLCVRKTPPAERAGLDLSSWSFAICGGEPVRAETIDRFTKAFGPFGFRRSSFRPSYGLAETCVGVSYSFPDVAPEAVIERIDGAKLHEGRAMLVEGRGGDGESRLIVSCGRPLDQTKVVVVNPDTLRYAPPGHIGEIWVSGPQVAKGYWNRADDTERSFQAFVAATGDGPFLRTGDLGYVRNGEIFISGRQKDLIILRGRNYYPQDIEYVVEQSYAFLRHGCSAAFSMTMEGVEELVVAVEVEQSMKTLRSPAGMAAVDGPERSASGRLRLSADSVYQIIRRAIAEEFDLPTYAVVLLKAGSIPKTSSGKIQRRACRTAFVEGRLDVVGIDLDAPQILAPPSVRGQVAHASARLFAAAPVVAPPIEVAPPPDLERWLADAIRRAIRRPELVVDPERPLAEYGLASTEAVAITDQLGRHLGRKIAATLFWEHPTVREAARALEARPVVEARRSMSIEVPRLEEPIAIVSMACRFAGGVSTPEELWAVLSAGRETVTDVPEARFTSERAYRGAFLANVDTFDADFFGISAREANTMDPQQRLLLETTWELFERAGIVPARLGGSPTGVYVGISGNDYQLAALRDVAHLDAHTLLGTSHSTIVGRVSYALGLRGPNLAVDTACSSSLVAVHLACQALRARECELAVAGGVNLLLAPEGFVLLEKLGALSKTGVCRAFSAEADGYVRGEGCGVVLLKRLRDAERDGDFVHAIVRGSAMNQDGRSNGFTAPSAGAQEEVIRRALLQARIDPLTVDVVECHGTGTPLGDPIELGALARVYGNGRVAERALVVGSVKTNLGHTEAAAGVAGLIKAVLALEHARVPRSLHAEAPNPYVAWNEVPIRVAKQAVDWPAPADRPRRAAVSSFGLSGTNAHVVLDEAPSARRATRPPRALPPGTQSVVVVSGRTEAALDAQLGALARAAADHPEVPAADWAEALATTRTHFAHRAAIVAEDARAIVNPAAILRGVAGTRPKVAFLFSGQGSQYTGMGLGLYEAEPVYRAAWDRCDEISRPLLGQSLDVLAKDAARLDETTFTQPLLFALEYALVELWRSWGVEPALVAGHSLGELVAACVAGVFGLEDGLRLAAARGRLTDEACGKGAMVAALAAPDEAEAVLARAGITLDVAAINGPAQVVFAGDEKVVRDAAAAFSASGVRAKLLRSRHAFHSAKMDAMTEGFAAAAAKVAFAPPVVPIVSNLSGGLAGPEIASGGYWRRHARATVRFFDGMRALAQQGADTFLEIGPSPVLVTMGKACLTDAGAGWLTSLRERTDDRTAIKEAVGALHVRGVSVDFRGMFPRAGRLRVPLPTYAFQRQRHWLDQLRHDEAAPKAAGAESGPSFLDRARASTEALRLRRVREVVLSEIAATLGGAAGEIEPLRPLNELGMDSVMALELRDRLAKATGLDLAPTVVFDHPTARALEEMLVHEIGGPAAEPAPAEAPPAPEGEALAKVSDDELFDLIDEELSSIDAEADR